MRKAISNIGSLAAVQGANALLPLVIYPITLARIGADAYGLLVQAEALSLFVLTLVLYSFEVTGVAAVVKLDGDKDRGRLSALLSQVLIARLVLLCIGMPLLCLAALAINPALVPIAAAWCLVPLSFALSPNWLFQGLQDNGALAISNVTSRGLAMALVLAIVQGPDTVILVPVIIGGCYLAGALASLAVAMNKHGLHLAWPQPGTLIGQYKAGGHVFLGNLSTLIYKDINTLLLGMLGASSGAIATYSMAEKLSKALQAAIRPLNQHYFPQAIRLAGTHQPPRAILAGMIRLSVIQQSVLAAMIVAAGVAYMLFGGKILAAIGGSAFAPAIGLFFLMSIATLFGVANFMLGTAGLNAMGRKRYVLVALVATSLASLLCGSLLIALWADIGAAISFVLGEAILLGLLLAGYLKRQPQEAPSV
ncbi:oligosaccharide flippase family protein [Pelagibacterium sp.]|uniref:oligosaccharide flippase family protein n=1 Tax=Pelagibacterium sp. TaxID=1967288 RepID=UPI003A91FD23